jgi:hypothetical protein
MGKDVSYVLESWNLDLNSPQKTPTSVAKFSVYKYPQLALSSKIAKHLLNFEGGNCV